MRMNKKGVFENFQGPVISLAVIGLVLVVTLLVIAQAKVQTASVEGLTSCAGQDANISFACNASESIENALLSFTDWFTIIVIVIIGVLLIALVKRIKS